METGEEVYTIGLNAEGTRRIVRRKIYSADGIWDHVSYDEVCIHCGFGAEDEWWEYNPTREAFHTRGGCKA